MSTHQQSTKKHITPEQIVAQQNADARRQKYEREHPAQAPLPDIVKAAVPAASDNRNAADKLADDLAPSFAPGPIIKFNGKDGGFELASSGETLDETTRYAALVGRHGPASSNSTARAHSQPVSVVCLTMTTRRPRGKASVISTPMNGQPGWTASRPIRGCVRFWSRCRTCTRWRSSRSRRRPPRPYRRRHVDAAYNRMRRTNPNEVPVVQLKASSYEHRTFGGGQHPRFRHRRPHHSRQYAAYRRHE